MSMTQLPIYKDKITNNFSARSDKTPVIKNCQKKIEEKEKHKKKYLFLILQNSVIYYFNILTTDGCGGVFSLKLKTSHQSFNFTWCCTPVQ